MLVVGELMVEPKDDLIQGVKNLIIQRLKLVDMTPEMIDRDAPLFGEGLGLDSIDALELVLGLEKEYGVIIPDAEVGKRVFQSVRTIAQYILEQKVGS
jgi:acyl carrier protein